MPIIHLAQGGISAVPGRRGRAVRPVFWTATRSLPLIPPLAHQGGVNSAAFSPDGTRVVTASADQTARVWDATTGKPLGAAPRASGRGVERRVQPRRHPRRHRERRQDRAGLGRRHRQAARALPSRIRERCGAPRSAPTVPASSPRATTTPRGSGTPRPASRSHPPLAHQGWVRQRRVQPRRHPRRHRERRPDRAGLGRRHRQAPRARPRASGTGEERRVQPRRHPRRHREHRQDRAGLGRRHRQAARPAARASGTGVERRVQPRRHPRRHRERRPDRAGLGRRHRQAARPARSRIRDGA